MDEVTRKPRRQAWAILLSVAALIAVVVVVPQWLKARERSAVRRTMVAIRTLADARDLRGQCIARRLEPSRDAWDRPLVVLASPTRSVVLSYGSDGRPDARYDGESFYDSRGDTIYSDGEWIHHHTSIATPVLFLPKPEDALAEASSCANAAALPPCTSYLYRASEAEARAVAERVRAHGFATSIKRSVTGEWICLASKQTVPCYDVAGELRQLTVSSR